MVLTFSCWFEWCLAKDAYKTDGLHIVAGYKAGSLVYYSPVMNDVLPAHPNLLTSSDSFLLFLISFAT